MDSPRPSKSHPEQVSDDATPMQPEQPLPEAKVVDTHDDWPLLLFQEWYDKSNNNSINNNNITRHVLDVRSESDFAQRRLRSTQHFVVVNIALSQLKPRRFELPPRSVPLVILMSRVDDLEQRARLQDCLGVTKRPSSNNHHKRKRATTAPQKPWNVRGILDGDDANMWQQASQLDLVHENKDSNSTLTPPSGVPHPRLWEPDLMVQHLLWPRLRQMRQQQQQQQQQQHEQRLEIWDLGAGAGRDVCYLAEQLVATTTTTTTTCCPSNDNGSLSLSLVALDQRYRQAQPETQDCVQFWTRRGVASHIYCVRLDLQDASAVEHLVQQRILTTTPTSPVVTWVVYAVRYWNRAFVQRLVEWKRKWGNRVTLLIAISQFGKPSAGAVWNFEHPKEKHVLERHELADLFADQDWKILHDRVVPDGDHGRTLIQFVAESI